MNLATTATKFLNIFNKKNSNTEKAIQDYHCTLLDHYLQEEKMMMLVWTVTQTWHRWGQAPAGGHKYDWNTQDSEDCQTEALQG